MAEEVRVLDRKGWPIQSGARIERYTKGGHKLSQDGVVITVKVSEKYPKGVVHYEAIGTMNRGVTAAELVRVMPESTDREKRTQKMKRYDYQREIITEASGKLSKRARRAARVASPR